jgi:MFS family permease
MFPEGRERTRAIGYYTAVSIGGSAIGLISGGILTQWVSWRWVLFVNVPIGLVVLPLAWMALPETARKTGRFDLPGALTSTLGMSAVVFGFVHAASSGWSTPETYVSFIVGVALLIGFVLVERTAAAPITPLRLFANRNRATSYLARLLLVAGMLGMFFFLTQFLQGVLNYSPVKTGLAFLPLTIALFAASQATARSLADRFSQRALMLSGLTLSTLGVLWLTQLGEGSGYGSILGPLLMFGTGNGLAFIPLTTLALAGVAPEDAGAASGLVNVMQQVGGSLGLSILVTIFGTASRHALAHPAAGTTAAQRATHAFIVGADRGFIAATVFLATTLVLLATVIRLPTAAGVDTRAVSSDELDDADLAMVDLAEA